MVLKLYGHDISCYTRLVAFILHEKQVPFEYHVVDLFRWEHKTEEHAKKHPFNYVPYIDDDGYILYESRAIAYYIAAKYAKQGTPLIPTDLHGLGLLHQALAIETAYFADNAEKMIHESIINPVKGIPTRPSVFNQLVSNLSGRLDVYDKILSKQRYIAGDTLTLADLIHVPVGAMLPAAGSDIISTKPNVNRWFNELTSRPSWQAVQGVISVIPAEPEPEILAHL